MADVLARTGRQKQRYEGEFRLVAGCIPYRRKENGDSIADNLENRLEVLMISSPDRNDLVFPKGGWEDDETVVEAACREALEEAGVEGVLDSKELGAWEFGSKSRQSCCGMEGYCRGVMFALEVTKEYDFWPEQSSHERRWLGINEAFKLCRYEWMQEALQAFVSNLSKEEDQDREDVVEEETNNPMNYLSEEYEGQAREDVGVDEADQPMSYLSEEYEGQAREDILEEDDHPTNYLSEEYEGQDRDDAVLEEADHPMSSLSEEDEGQAREDFVLVDADNPLSYLSEEYEAQAIKDGVLEEANHPMCYEDGSEEADRPNSCLSEEYEELAGESLLEVADHPIRSPQMCYSFDTQHLDDPPMVALY